MNLGNSGKHAITELFRHATEKGVIPEIPAGIFSEHL
jgi:predicted solute-binding protein